MEHFNIPLMSAPVPTPFLAGRLAHLRQEHLSDVPGKNRNTDELFGAVE